ncbi:hypothetical protein EMILIAHAH_225 [Bacillus phage vB_BanH_Emiliahah]|nr:hypothetical protein EMILIAHAH_225 [Bacillus phage vB_BanH_Emiliahah]
MNQQDFRSVTLLLQNGSKITVDKLMITVLRLDNLHCSIHIEGGVLFNVIEARKAVIRIRKTASIGGDSAKFTKQFEAESAVIVSKLKRSDIVSMVINFENGEKKDVSVYWGYADFSLKEDTRNPNQEVSIEETTGDFCIGIGY